MKRTPIARKTPLRAKSWGIGSGPRAPLAKRGRVKTKREKRYHAHLSSKYWLTLRHLRWQRDGGLCQAKVCLRGNRTIQGLRDMHLAHKRYARFGEEHLDDVQCEHPECNMAERQSRAWYAGQVA